MYLWKKRVGSRDLGIHPTYANRIKNRRVPLSDTVLERLLEYLTAEELAELTGVYVIEKVEPHTLIQVVKAGLADPQLRDLVINKVMRYVDLGEYELHEFRSFFTSRMIQHGAQEIWVNIFQGRAPPKQFEVMINHYLQPVLEKRGTWKQALIQIRERFYEPYAYNIL